jgi:hypothetical protein
MDFSLYFNNDSFCTINKLSEATLCNSIDMFDLTIASAEQFGDSVFSDREIYYLDLLDEKPFCDWLYDTTSDNPSVKEKKLLLQKALERSNKVDTNVYESIMEKIESQTRTSPDFSQRKAFITLNAESITEWYIREKTELPILYRIYKHNAKNPAELLANIEQCFLNLYFHNNILNSLKTLNRNFSDAKEEIIEHLTAIDHFIEEARAFRKNTTTGYIALSAQFTSIYGIPCSPQGGRSGVSDLKANFSYKDENNLEVICEIKCEMHTKFSTHNGDPENQDRLYFHPGRDEIESGKILVYHIGDHK